MTDLADTFEALYNNGASVSDIALAFPPISEAEVTAVLMEKSSSFRSKMMKERDPNKPLADRMLDVMVDIVEHSKNDALRFNVARYVRDDQKGRRDAVPTVAGEAERVIAAIEQRMADFEKKKLAFKQGRLNAPEPIIIDAGN